MVELETDLPVNEVVKEENVAQVVENKIEVSATVSESEELIEKKELVEENTDLNKENEIVNGAENLGNVKPDENIITKDSVSVGEVKEVVMEVNMTESLLHNDKIDRTESEIERLTKPAVENQATSEKSKEKIVMSKSKSQSVLKSTLKSSESVKSLQSKSLSKSSTSKSINSSSGVWKLSGPAATGRLSGTFSPFPEYICSQEQRDDAEAKKKRRELLQSQSAKNFGNGGSVGAKVYYKSIALLNLKKPRPPGNNVVRSISIIPPF